MLSVSSAFVVIILLLHKLVFWYLNIDNNHAFLILAILTIGILGFSFYNIFGLNYFIIQRQDKLVMRNTIFSSLIGFVTAFPFIYYLGITGAAINLSFSRWLMGGGLYYQYLKRTRH